MIKGGIALQMYTVRDDQSKDFRGTLTKVAQMGYPAVEFAGYGGLDAEQIKDLLAELGIVAAGTNTGIEALQKDFGAVVRFHHTIGAKFVTAPSLPGNRYSRDEAGFQAAAKDLGELGRRLAAEGLALGYHNHDFEFFKADGRYGLDILYEETDPTYLRAELDVFWAKKGGVDPAEYMRKLGPRCSLVHIKDMAADGSFAEVGTGSIDFDSIFAAGESIGSEWYIVEQDVCKGRPPLEAVALSLDNLRRWGRL